MRYILAILCPPLALFLIGRIYSALFNIALGILWLDNLAGGPLIWRHIQNLPAPALAIFVIVFSGVFGPALNVIHALLLVIHDDKERRHKETLRAMNQSALMQKGFLRQLTQRTPQVIHLHSSPTPRAIPQNLPQVSQHHPDKDQRLNKKA